MILFLFLQPSRLSLDIFQVSDCEPVSSVKLGPKSITHAV